jgi:pimeloyl-ACP methyl ester carboxylesterase
MQQGRFVRVKRRGLGENLDSSAFIRDQKMTLSVLGVPVHVLDRGTGEPLLFLHGNPDSSDAWTGVIDHLGEGYRCIAPDWPGFGRSQPAPDFDYSLSGHARFVAALLDAIGVSERVTVIGHDFGGVFGCAFAVEHQERVRRLVMMNTQFSASYKWHRVAQIWRTPVLGELFFAFTTRGMFVRGLRSGSPNLPEEYANQAYELLTGDTKKAILRLYRESDPEKLVGWEERLLALTNRIPTLAIWGDQDPYISPSYAEWFGGRSHHVKEAGHWLQVEAPEEVARVLWQFLEETK